MNYLKHPPQPILLPPYRPFVCRNEVDRYGASWVFANKCNLVRPPRSFSNWVHGWIWADQPSSRLLACSNLRRSTKIIVRSEQEREALVREGFTAVIVGGLPFAYVPPQNTTRIQGSLLVVPAHSAGSEEVRCGHEHYLDYLLSEQKNFSRIIVCIYYLDKGKEVEKQARRRGFEVVYGARPDDANSLLRMRTLFDSVEYVTSNTMGSHMIYALSAGCKFSFCGPFYEYERDVFLGGGNVLGHSIEHVEELLYIQSEGYIRQRFGKFFKESPLGGFTAVDFANETLGRELLSADELRHALGWRASDQVVGYCRGAVNRLARLAVRSLRIRCS